MARDTVVLVHGFGGKRLWMLPLARRLRSRYRVVNWSYNSFSGSIEEHAERFYKFLSGLEHQGRVNIVAHSMGSIVTRAALSMGPLSNVNRVVMLAPPNSGSHVAKYAKPIFGFFCRPITELSSGKNSFVNQLPRTNTHETGVIASRYDILVPIQNTRMQDLADHRVVGGTHNSLLFNKKVASMADHFFQKGRFVESIEE